MACPFMNSSESTKGGADNQEMHYRTYLEVDTLLSLQKPVTEKKGNLCHDEHLFITVHQVYELWFKQILKELESVISLLQDHDSLPIAVRRLERATQILEHTTTQFPLLESMTPLDFREFRDHLAPASGFQSHQFRYIENIVGVRPDDRVPYNRENYRVVFKDHKDVLDKFDATEKATSLLTAVNSWLEEVYDKEDAGENFWRIYEQTMKNFIGSKPNEEEKKAAADKFASLLDEEDYKECSKRGDRRLSYKAFKSALMVMMRRDECKYSEPYRFLQLLVTLDVTLTKWRFMHLMTVQQLIGPATAGTAGSSGVPYLKATLGDPLKVFLDLSHVTSLLLPRPLLKEAEERQALDNLE
ncbi:tryptophan 2,3-dioxygenase [Hyalella azteca]|uniref:Tryptophan 2,3-dioxygenase n=1 Tax=Hyalella azteca TaxID=294128 RepID=A0A8B7NVB3_HYAAZ|nr:tryptophan 2,3-dioxygenase [Hyalella azteca]